MEMNKKHYYVIVEQENGKNYAFTETIRESENLLSVLFKRHPKATSINAFSTIKCAEEIAIAWNEDFKRNGTYMFDKIGF